MPIPPVVPAGRMSGAAQPVLTLPGRTLLLRPWEERDAAVLAESCREPEIRRWNRPGRLSVPQARQRIVRYRERWHLEAAAVWAVAPADDGAAVGLIGLADLDLRAGSGEIMYWLLPAGRGNGVMVAAVNQVGRWAFDELGLHRVRITHSVANPASCRVADQAGYRLEGTMRSALLHEDSWHDEHLHARISGDA
jgi:RimJ/RimL family protein N-acetyltransferase